MATHTAKMKIAGCKFILAYFLFAFSFQCFSQKTENKLTFVPMLGSQKLELGEKYFLQKVNDSISIETFKFYISNLSFLKKRKTIHIEKDKFYLMDTEGKMSISTAFSESFDEVSFCIGIDSLTNVSGAMGGDLDPTNGMYWAWQSGYINFKLEGKSTKCKTRNQVFQFHIGGYLPPYASMQVVSLDVPNKQNIEIEIHLEKFLSEIDLSTTNEIMSPSEKAVELSRIYSTVFSLKK